MAYNFLPVVAMRHLLVTLLLLSGCGEKPENEYINPTFQLPFQMTARDTVAVGDTLCHADDSMATNNMLANLF